jgi:alkanesulfonate monooxygenase SsuD/methylene tetrahydromethanopterin reductase-like flavin-dependent oxidoreductase (luciferase family)
VLIAANGPLGQAAAGELADGLCTSLPRGGAMPEIMASVQRGAAKAGRTLPPGFHTAALVNVLMLEPGERLDSPRVIAEVGPAVMTNFHYLVDWVRETGKAPPAFVRPVWADYMAFRRARASADTHLTMHATHYATLDPEEARFLTPEIIRALCIIGEAADLVERLRELERQGLRQITFHPPFERRYEVMERFARQVMEKM